MKNKLSDHYIIKLKEFFNTHYKESNFSRFIFEINNNKLDVYRYDSNYKKGYLGSFDSDRDIRDYIKAMEELEKMI